MIKFTICINPLNKFSVLLYLIISFAIIVLLTSMTNKSRKLVYSNWNLTKESLYDTIYGIVTSQINKYYSQIYFPFIYTLFIFILINNII